jgi:hypothetical protein
MLISELNNKEEILSLISKELKDGYGIRIRAEKSSQKSIDLMKRRNNNRHIFKRNLIELQLSDAIFSNGKVSKVPKFVLLACQHIQR